MKIAESTQSWFVIGPLMAGMVALFTWIGKHTSNSSKHPCSSNLVFKDVCEERGKANTQEHKHLSKGIEHAIARSNEQHLELKNSMKDGFTEIKTLIQNK